MVAALYNYLPTGYTNQYNAKYNTHKKSELRNIYNAIVKLNNQSPLYMFRPTFENQVYVLRLKDSAIGLSAMLAEYDAANPDSVFHSKRAVSSDPSIVSAEIITTDYDKLPEEFSVKVKQLAKAQINVGESYGCSGRGLVPGTYSFAIDIEEDLFQYQFTIPEKSNNYENQKKFADFINQIDIGLTATVSVDKAKDKSKLVIDSDETGSSNEVAFSFEDIPGVSSGYGLIDYFGLNHVSVYPANSSFEINGVKKESLSNSFTYNRSVAIHLKSVSDTPVTIGYDSDNQQIEHSIEALMDSYNHLVAIAKDNNYAQKRSSLLLQYLTDVTHDYESELESCGLSITDGCALDIDKSLVLSAEESDFRKLLTNPDGFAAKLADKMLQISLDPMEYMDKTIVTYPNMSRPPYPNPYITSMYSGMLYNYYC